MNLLQQFFGNKKFVFSVMVLLPLIVIALFGPLIIRHDPLEMNTKRVLEPPSTDFLLGTDEYGRCILCRMIIGIRPHLVCGVRRRGGGHDGWLYVGTHGRLYWGKLGNVIMRAIDIVLCFPPILLAMLVVGLWGTGIINLLLVIGILYTPHFCRIAYSTTLKLRKAEFVENQRIFRCEYAAHRREDSVSEYFVAADHPIQHHSCQWHSLGKWLELLGSGRSSASSFLGADDREGEKPHCNA